MGWIASAWRGEERLWKAFWIYGVLLGIAIGIVAVVIKSVFGLTAYLLFWIPRAVYMIWLTVAQWRCAFNAEWTIWGYVVRILIIISIIAIPLGLLGGGVLVGQDLIKAAECRKELKEYVAQGGTDVEGFKKQCVERQTHKSAEPTQGSDSARPGIMDAVNAGIECSKEVQNYQKNGGTDVKEFQHKCIRQRLHEDDAPQPSNAAPAMPPVNAAPGSPQEKYKQLCEKTMTDYAQKAGADPVAYIAQNQAYLQQCIQYYVSQDAAGNNKQ